MMSIKEKIVFAIYTNRIIQFNYTKRNGEKGARTGEPYEIRTTRSGNQLLVLWDLTRNAWRCFHMENIKGVKVLDETFRNRRVGYIEPVYAGRVRYGS
jgi:predicted DNA-binding transcriptional regulator YafY